MVAHSTLRLHTVVQLFFSVSKSQFLVPQTVCFSLFLQKFQLPLGLLSSLLVTFLLSHLSWSKVELTHTVRVRDQKGWKKVLPTF